MNPSSFPSDPQRRRRISVRHGGATPETATSSAAEAAIREFVDRRDRRRRGASTGAAPRISPPDAVARRPGRGAPSATPHAWRIVRVIVFVAVVAVLWQAVAGFGARRPATHDPSLCGFSGSVVLDGKPLAQGVLEFHPLAGGAGGGPLPVETDDKGGFMRPASHGVAAGRYAVVVRSGCAMPRPGAEVGTSVVIPTRYQRAESTPLQVAVTPSARFDLVMVR